MPCLFLLRKFLRARPSRAKLAPVNIKKSCQKSGGRASRRSFLQKALGLSMTLGVMPAHATTLGSAVLAKYNMIRWQTHDVAKIPDGYQVAVADVNGDGRLDILGLSSAHNVVEWYENPTWKPRSITTTTRHNISLAPLFHSGYPAWGMGGQRFCTGR